MTREIRFDLLSLLLAMVCVSGFLGLNLRQRVEEKSIGMGGAYVILRHGFPFTVQERESDAVNGTMRNWSEFAFQRAGWRSCDPEDAVPFKDEFSYFNAGANGAVCLGLMVGLALTVGGLRGALRPKVNSRSPASRSEVKGARGGL